MLIIHPHVIRADQPTPGLLLWLAAQCLLLMIPFVILLPFLP
jgi:hypothetical protein